MKVVAAIDSFKGSATSAELNQAVLSGFSDQWEKRSIPIADGGEGSMAAVIAALGGNYETVSVTAPLGGKLQARMLITKIKEEKIALIESAGVIGLQLVEPSDETTRNSSSFGLGQMVLAACKQGVKKIYLTLGGSGTSDGGVGFLLALGAKITTNGQMEKNPLLQTDALQLSELNPLLKQIELFALADVTNPYSGEQGFAPVFGPQKGASKETVQQLDQQAKRLAEHIKQTTGTDLEVPGAGAAGGLGGAVRLAGGQLVPGFATIASLIGFEEKIKGADLLITGEGRIDGQTAGGKVPYGVALLAHKHQVPVVAICGSRSDDPGKLPQLLSAVFCIQQGPVSLTEAMEKKRTLVNTQQTAQAIAGFVEQWQKKIESDV
ncbi:glycerate kinase family protein [Enterococcus innesii]|uniref:glycerate kinase family protein n=1 Tax=Enterococcus innesii TaxID=2839759 RepID=UPI002DBEAF54|nr:glycerate kinase [Enterococcus innesii]MEB5950356.1 glycerate kinase [Enterococcus innesii]